jgi:hypothetical protein
MEDQGGYRCPHRSDAENFEVYPRLEADGSFVIHVIARNDDGTNVQSVVLDCGE